MKSCYKEMLLSKGYIVVNQITQRKENVTDRKIAAIIKSFSSLGYALTKESLELLTKLSDGSLNYLYNENISTLRRAKGDDVDHIIFYREFPNMEKITDEEYYVRAILHYITATEDSYGFMNQDKKIKRIIESLSSNEKDILSILTEEEANKIIIQTAKNLFESNLAIPQYNIPFLREVIKDFFPLLQVEEIPFKENLAIYISLIVENAKLKGIKLSDALTMELHRFVKTSTDLLRIYAVISDSNSNGILVEKIKFVSLDRKTRRLFLTILNNINNSNNYMIDDLVKHEFYWKKAFEKLHVGEFSNKFPKLCSVVSNFRNDEYKTYYGLVETSLENGNFEVALKQLSKRPGEFARKLDRLLRNYNQEELILTYFKKCVHLVSSNVLLQLWDYYKNRSVKDDRLFVINKQNGSSYFYTEDSRKEISDELTSKVISIIEDGLKKIYSTYKRVEKVYLDESLKNYAVPTNSRNGSCQNKTLTFGSRVKLNEDEGSFIRLFTHWKNASSRVDIDLAIELYTEDFSKCKSVSWHNMGGGSEFNTYHSGDITSAPQGASEFIDLDYLKAREKYRYVVVTNYVYTGQEYFTIPECFSGVMFFNKDGKKGKVFDPQFVKHKFDLTQKGTNSNIAFVIDLFTMEMIWVDQSKNSGMCGYSEGDKVVVHLIKKALKNHMNMYDFFMLHKNHLSLVESKEDADFIVSDEHNANIKPYDIEVISNQWF